MKLRKRILKSDWFNVIVSRLVAYLMRFSYFTTRWQLHNYKIPEEYIQADKPLLVAMWHDQLMTAPCAWRFSKPLHVLASQHSDGKLIAKIVESFGMRPVYGSTGKCAISSLKQLITICKEGNCLAIIPDGPRGPRHIASQGIVTIAQMTQTDILVYASVVKRFKQCNSWDKFIIAYPFNKGVISLDILKYEDIKDMPVEEACNLLTAKLNDQLRFATEKLEDV